MSRPALPLRDGVSPSRIWLPARPASSLSAFLASRFPDITEIAWRDRMARGLVLDAEGLPSPPDAAYRPDSACYYYRELPPDPQPRPPLPILHADEHLLVIDKPHFVAVMPAGRFLHDTLLVRLRAEGGLDDLAPLHRLDRDTAGVILFSVNPSTRDAYAALFRERRIEKTYEAVADAAPAGDFPQWRRSCIARDEDHYRRREVPGPVNAETWISQVASAGRDALYRIRPHTGQTHQIRVHMAALGLPLRHDRLYPSNQRHLPDDPARPLQLLARSLAFEDPVSGQPRRFVSARALSFPAADASAS